MTFQANDSVKDTIIKCLKNDDLFHLVSCSSDPSPAICLKTLCTLRNLVSKETVSTNALRSVSASEHVFKKELGLLTIDLILIVNFEKLTMN